MKTLVIICGVLLILMVLSAITYVSITINASSSMYMEAEELPDKPQEYLVITNVDPVFMQAISHLDEWVSFSSLDETQVDELIDQYSTNNVEYQDNYYTIYFHIVEGFSYSSFILSRISLISFVVSIILLVSIGLLKRMGYIRKRN